jgi:Putative MetA-pathway of phenol degradation
MFARVSHVLLALILGGMASLHGQDQPLSVDAAGLIATDRPAVRNSIVVVPASLQVENGFLETSSQGQSVLDGPESLARFGVATRTELRFTLPDYFHSLTSGGGSGFGEVTIGVKRQLGPTHRFDVSVIPFLSFPTGANGLSSGGYDPGLQVPCLRARQSSLTNAGGLRFPVGRGMGSGYSTLRLPPSPRGIHPPAINVEFLKSSFTENSIARGSFCMAIWHGQAFTAGIERQNWCQWSQEFGNGVAASPARFGHPNLVDYKIKHWRFRR